MWKEYIKMILHLIILCVAIRPLCATNTTENATTDVDYMSTDSTPTGYANMTDDSSMSDNSTGTQLPTTNQTEMSTMPGSTLAPGPTSTAIQETSSAPRPTTGASESTAVQQPTTSPGATEPTSTMPTPVSTMMMTSPTGVMTSSPGGGETTTSGMDAGPLQLPHYIAIGVGGAVVLILIVVVLVLCFRRCIRKNRKKHSNCNRDEVCFGDDELDKLSPKDRMSVHRPVSATEDAEGDLAFVTFNTGAPGKDSKIDGVENPSFDEESALTATGAKDQDGTATMPSTARLSAAGNVEGGIAKDAGKEDVDKEEENGKVRPQSGVSYASADIDIALETIDIGNV